MKLNSINAGLFILMIALLFAIYYRQTVTAQNDNMKCKSIKNTNNLYQSGMDTNFRWHPVAIYVMLPDMKFEFKLPFEEDQSGVANLLFQDKTSGEIHLLDTIIKRVYKDIPTDLIKIADSTRYYVRFKPGKYYAILLYNNGKYIKSNDFDFEKDIDTVVDMEKLSVHSADSASEQWLTLRGFNAAAIGMRKLPENCATDIKKIRGYIFHEDGEALGGAGVWVDDRTFVNTQSDGYFEIDGVHNYQNLKIGYLAVERQDINIKTNSGLFLVTKAEKFTAPENLTTRPLIKSP